MEKQEIISNLSKNATALMLSTSMSVLYFEGIITSDEYANIKATNKQLWEERKNLLNQLKSYE